MCKHNKKSRKSTKNIPFFIKKNGLTYYKQCLVGCYSSNPEYYQHTGTFEIFKKFHFSDDHCRIHDAIATHDYISSLQQ